MNTTWPWTIDSSGRFQAIKKSLPKFDFKKRVRYTKIHQWRGSEIRDALQYCLKSEVIKQKAEQHWQGRDNTDDMAKNFPSFKDHNFSHAMEQLSGLQRTCSRACVTLCHNIYKTVREPSRLIVLFYSPFSHYSIIGRQVYCLSSNALCYRTVLMIVIIGAILTQ